MKKIIMITVGAIVIMRCIETLFFSLFIGGVFFAPLTYEGAEKKFKNEKETMYAVSKYFSDMNYEDIYISFSIGNDIMKANGDDIKIESDEVARSLKRLKKNGCSVIEKENNSVYFQMWCNLDTGRGIAFSVDGTTPTSQYLTKVEKLSEANWYYYEED